MTGAHGVAPTPMDVSAATAEELARFAGESAADRDRRLKKRKNDHIADKKRKKQLGRGAPPSELELVCRVMLCGEDIQ